MSDAESLIAFRGLASVNMPLPPGDGGLDVVDIAATFRKVVREEVQPLLKEVCQINLAKCE